MNTEKIAIILLLVAAIIFMIIHCSIAYETIPAFRETINGIRADVQKADGRSRYETMKQVEDTYRSMIASYRSDQLYYEQCKQRQGRTKPRCPATKLPMIFNGISISL